MALITVGIPVYSGLPEENFDYHIDRFAGYLASLAINPLDFTAPLATCGNNRSMGLFRSSLSGEAGIWFDEKIAGKRWKLKNLYNNHGQANWTAIRGRTMQQLTTSNSFRPGSEADTYARTAGNNAVTLTNSGMVPAQGICMDWTALGGEPTDDPATVIAVGGLATPIVFASTRVGEAIWYFSENYKAIVQERREIQFGNLVQGDDPVGVFYKNVERAGKLLKFTQPVIENQFFRGLNEENLLEIERFGDKPIKEFVETLGRIEKRRDQIRSGMSKRNIQQKTVIPIQAPPVSGQEPAVFKQVDRHAITQDMLNQLLQQHTENITKNLTDNFQTQLQTLQEKVSQPPVRKPPLPSKSTENMQKYYEGANPYDYTLSEEDRQNLFDWTDSPKQQMVMKIAKRVARKIERAEEDKLDRDMARAMRGLNINDTFPEPMDTSNLVCIGDVEVDADDLNVYIANLIRSQKKR